MVVQLQRVAGLLDVAIAHDHDLVTHRHRLDLVVRDVDRRGLQPLVQLFQLGAHRHAQLGIEVGQRLVVEKHLRVAHDRAAHRHALALAARQLARKALEQRGQAQDLGGALDLLVDGGLALLGQRERERHVVAHRHVRVQRVVLEHHRDVALFRLHVVDDLAADADLAAADVLQPGDHAQQRALAAARRAHQHGERAIGDLDVHAVQHLDIAEALFRGNDIDTGHAADEFEKHAASMRATGVHPTRPCARCHPGDTRSDLQTCLIT